MSQRNDAAILSAVLRQDLTAFIWKTFATVDGSQAMLMNWHIQLIADRLMLAYERRIKRLIITLPPRNLKSICASVAFPAWALGRNPKLRFICASYSQDLASKHARDCRTVMQAPWYRRTFPGAALNPDKLAEGEFETMASGYRLSTSVGGTLTGRGGNIIIIDDPIKPQEAQSELRRQAVKQWYDSTLYSRLDSKKDDVIILIMQRVHVDDLVAHVLEKEDWEHLDLPAIAAKDESFRLCDDRTVGRRTGEALHPEREPLSLLEDLRKSMGTFQFSAQYLQAPVPAEGNLIRRDWLAFYDQDPVRERGDMIVQSWDLASSLSDAADWSVCTTWLVRKSTYYLLHVQRVRLDFPALVRTIASHAKVQLATSVLIETVGVGLSLAQQLRSQKVHVIERVPQGSKVDRMAGASALIESGAVQFPKSAPWLDDYVAELLAFPGGRHDDQVDSTSQFLGWQIERGQRRAVVF